MVKALGLRSVQIESGNKLLTSLSVSELVPPTLGCAFLIHCIRVLASELDFVYCNIACVLGLSQLVSPEREI